MSAQAHAGADPRADAGREECEAARRAGEAEAGCCMSGLLYFFFGLASVFYAGHCVRVHDYAGAVWGALYVLLMGCMSIAAAIEARR